LCESKDLLEPIFSEDDEVKLSWADMLEKSFNLIVNNCNFNENNTILTQSSVSGDFQRGSTA